MFIYFPNYEKLKSSVKTFTPYNQILIFKEQLCYAIFDIDQAQLNSEVHKI